MIAVENTTAGGEEESVYRDQLIKHLLDVGMDRDEAELVLVDEDLWILTPEQRFGFPPGEESVREWEQTVRLVKALAQGTINDVPPLANRATTQLIWDAEARAEEALRRARERAGL